MIDWIFQAPAAFALLLIVPVWCIFYWLYWRKQQPVIIISSVSAGNIRKAVFSPPDILFFLKMLALIFVIVALADPVSVRSEKYGLSKTDIAIVLALDVSGSMLIEDLKPNRLEALKAVVANFIAARSTDRFGLVIYAGESMVWSPLTSDSRFLLKKIAEMNNKEMADGTAIGLGLASAVNTIKSSTAKNKVIILLTDGENNAGFIDPLTASAIAKKYGVKVYTIGVGTTGKAPLPVTDLDGNKSYQYIDATLDEPLLKKIASETGGSYFRATDSKALKSIYTQINALEKTKADVQYRKVADPQYRYCIGIALFLVLLGQLLNLTFLRTVN
ncbi:vWA domain-containing protein [Pedobacter metabolipauper]|uniref:Ca-activated chloride channel family protein n=1 Tax=Pedobacter metabolipauper TaxID=425513 RepID=A0A4R6SUG7_9SPHI|nr:VWA domain-containing protein [Pedobacter metabolipauper]TDQ09428.1 Ca-activated chloride channel family protein [Pedobacter metabolipauper]